MALVHTVQFESIREMIVGVTEVYTQFPPKDAIPKWWKRFTDWVEKENLDKMPDLEKKLDAVEKDKLKPDWWKLAEKDFKSAKSIKSVTLRTEPFTADDGDESEDEDDDDYAVAKDEDEPEDEGEGDDGEGEGDDDDEDDGDGGESEDDKKPVDEKRKGDE